MKRIKTIRLAVIGFLLLFASFPTFAWGGDSTMHVYFDPAYAEIQAKQGEQISYTVKAYTDMNDEIRYALDYSEDGMTIDSVTGEFRWVSNQFGWYSVAVKAYLLNHPNEEAYLRMSIMIYSPEQEPCGYIKGNIKFDNGKPYAGAYVTVEPVTQDSSGYPGYNSSTNTDSNGNYSINLPKGSYYLGVWGNYNDMIWYQNTHDKSQAEKLNLDCGQTLSADFTLKESDFDYIYFMSYPDYMAYMNGKYTYQAEAVSMLGKEIRYKLLDGPTGMTIDSVSGLLVWTPTAKGDFTAKISAYTAENPDVNAEQDWSIMVVDSISKPCAYINGTVKDKDGNPIMYAMISVFTADSIYGKNYYGGYYEGFADSTGFYSINVPDGNYYLIAYGQDFMPTYYENTQDFNSAKILNVVCDNTYSVNFEVEKYRQPNYYTVRGTVTAEKDGSPLEAMVSFIPDDGSKRDSTNPTWGYGYDAYTDKDGKYEISLPDNVKYVAEAQTFGDEYLPEFYDNVKNITDATTIELTQDLSGIDFSLSSRPSYNNGLYGIVLDSARNGVTAAVSAYLYENGQFMGQGSRTVMTDSAETGKFKITNMIPGKYVLFAIPFSKDVAPGFYIDGDFATFDWEKATQIDVPADAMVDKNHEIILKNYSGLLGIAVLDGYVFGEVSLAKKTAGGKIQSTSPLQGVNVTVMDMNGGTLDNSITDQNGYYALNNIGVGAYKIIYSKIGYGTYETEISFDMAKNAKQNNNVTLMPKGTTGVDDATTVNANEIEIYPQPANDVVELKFASQQGDAIVSISNIVGGLVMTKQVKNNGNNANLFLDVSSLPSGSYFITISGNSSVHHALLQIAR
jgi:hypothetical protein